MKSAVLVIDMQCALFKPMPPPGDADAVIARINALTARARRTGVPVVFIQHQTATEPMRAGSAGWNLVPALAVEATDLRLDKTTPDAFLHTGLQAMLHAHAIDRLVVCGYASEFCVDTTVRRAAAHGYPVTLVADAHTTHDKPHASAARIRAHENATLPAISSFGVRIQALPATEIVFG